MKVKYVSKNVHRSTVQLTFALFIPFLLEIRSTTPVLTVHIHDLEICNECRTLSPRKNFSTEIERKLTVFFGLSMPLTFPNAYAGLKRPSLL
jgi:hypothetical protein